MLRTSRWILKGLLWLNILVGVPLLLVLGYSLAAEERFLAAAAERFPEADPQRLMLGARWALALVAPVMVAAHLLLRRLLAILRTVESGDPFVAVNARRLQTVAWCLLAIQLCDVGFGIADMQINLAAGERVSGWSPGLTGWIAVLMTFVLARIFREGARLRDDAELTI